MKFFVDTAEIADIKDLASTGLLDGVTTNPTLIAKAGKDFIEVTREICALVDGPVSPVQQRNLEKEWGVKLLDRTGLILEIFADRAYLANGQLVPRSRAGAVIQDAETAVTRRLGFMQTGRMPVLDGDPIPLAAQSICVHGDSPNAVQMAQLIRARLTAEGIGLAPFLG